MPVQKMGPQDDPEAFLDLFEKTAEACGWPQTDWPVRLIPLLTGEAQLAAQQLPVQNLLVYDDLKRAILQRVGRSPEQHRHRFRSLELGENGRPFTMAHQLQDACVHGDVVKYPVVLLTIQFRGQKHNVEVAVNPHLRHPLILGTNWPAFKVLLGVLCVDASCGKEKPGREAAVRTGEAEPGPAEAAPGERNAVERLVLTERDDFPLERVPLTASLSSPHGPLPIPILLS